MTARRSVIAPDSNLTESDVRRQLSIFRAHFGTWAESYELEFSAYGCGQRPTRPGKLSEPQTNQLLAYARSMVRRATRRRETLAFVSSHAPSDIGDGYRFQRLDDLVADLGRMSLQEKAIRTLENLTEEEQGGYAGVKVPLVLDPYPGSYSCGPEHDRDPHGLFYAAEGNEALVVLHNLRDQGFIKAQSTNGASTLFITPAGYKAVESVTSGTHPDVMPVFLICRFTEDLDNMYKDVYCPAGKPVNCRIERVKDVQHIDCIDDKILRLIRESAFVVVDLTDHNFNVAFEAGFALALGKPIVWTMRRQEGDLRLPFDIQNHNILFWNDLADDGFRQSLQERLRIARDRATPN